jgi:hypothetical protein
MMSNQRFGLGSDSENWVTTSEDVESDDEQWASEVAVCASLAKLTCLQDLTVGGSDDLYKLNLLRGDALALTALTSLTRLDLSEARHGVGTAVATALARSLQQLQSLDFRDCCLQLDGAEGFALLEAIGHLTQLTELRLDWNEGMTPHGLMQLTGLSRLYKQHCKLRRYSYRGNGNHGIMTDDVLEEFWAAVAREYIYSPWR